MSSLALFGLFEYLCYGCTVIGDIFTPTIAPPYFLHHNKVSLSSVQVADSGISTSKCARNIGVM